MNFALCKLCNNNHFSLTLNEHFPSFLPDFDIPNSH